MQLNGNYYQLLNLVVFFALSFPVLAEEPLKGLETEIRDTAVSNINKKKINSDLDVPESLKGSQNIYKELRVGDHR
ncbi:MAG: hypothetical protein OEY52_13150, partial [Gammaproteobacteria bacterium]|nr:hypothetical protein [Gammaproteobacteria bacterium]